MEIQEYISKNKSLYTSFLEFIDCSDDERDEKLDDLLSILNNAKFLDDLDGETYQILVLIDLITKYHHRRPDFYDRIEKIFDLFESKIKQSFTKAQIFDIFKTNKRFLLLLFNRKIIEVDENILNFIIYDVTANKQAYKYYFFDEIKDKVQLSMRKSLETELLKIDPNIFDNFSEKCQAGENESPICSLIRDDLVEDFIVYINRSNISPSSRILRSIFETNKTIVAKNPTLIEYAAFFGSIQIFQYLKYNGADMNPSLWKYSIHGRNPEIIHLLEENNIVITDNLINKSLKYHHNEFASYFREQNITINNNHTNVYNNTNVNNNTNDNFFIKVFNSFKSKFFTNKTVSEVGQHPTKPNENIFDDGFYKYVFLYRNYEFIPDNLNESDIKLFIKYMCQYNYTNCVALLVKSQVINFNNTYGGIFILKFLYNITQNSSTK